MHIFISHSHHDKPAVDRIIARLTSDGHSVWDDTTQLKPGDNFVEKIEKELKNAEAFLIVISESSSQSEWVRREYSAIALQQISDREARVIPIKLDQSAVPSYLASRQYIDFSQNFGAGLERLSEALQDFKPAAVTVAREEDAKGGAKEDQILRLRQALREGQLTLMCGAGVSMGAGVPAWNELLVKLLDAMMERLSKKHSFNAETMSAKDFERLGSSMILGKYLKNSLGKDFPNEVRKALYESNPKSGELLDSIVELARPQRDGRPIDSIVTFNFDCLVEDHLTMSRILNRPIYSEATRHEPNELPIYHVHGYLPRDGDIPRPSDLVFSEDAYHSQFIEPFSWANLIQLNKLTQNTCLFVGISLTDPNMRRLLDVAWRKNPDKTLGHYIIKRVPQFGGKTIVDEVSKLLEEHDANALGLNVIWIDKFKDIPKILKKIVNL